MRRGWRWRLQKYRVNRLIKTRELFESQRFDRQFQRDEQTLLRKVLTVQSGVSGSGTMPLSSDYNHH